MQVVEPRWIVGRVPHPTSDVERAYRLALEPESSTQLDRLLRPLDALLGMSREHFLPCEARVGKRKLWTGRLALEDFNGFDQRSHADLTSVSPSEECGPVASERLAQPRRIIQRPQDGDRLAIGADRLIQVPRFTGSQRQAQQRRGTLLLLRAFGVGGELERAREVPLGGPDVDPQGPVAGERQVLDRLRPQLIR